MLADTPEPLDFSVLQSRIKEVAASTAAISEKEFKEVSMTKAFVNYTLLPILNTPNIYQLLQDPDFTKQLSDLVVNYVKFLGSQSNGT